MSDNPTRAVSEADDYPESSYGASPLYPAQAGASTGFEAVEDLADDRTADLDLGGAAATVDLDSDPFADDLSRELAAAARKKWVNRATFAVGALVLITGGFLGGIQVQKHFGTSSAGGLTASDLAALRGRATSSTGTGGFGGGGGTGTRGGGGTGSAGQTGTVKLVDGSTIYVSLPDGTVLTVTTNSSTKVTSSSSVSSIKAGDTVTVTGGTPDSSGNMTATSVTDSK